MGKNVTEFCTCNIEHNQINYDNERVNSNENTILMKEIIRNNYSIDDKIK